MISRAISALRHVCKVVKSCYSICHVCLAICPSAHPSARLEQLSSQRMDFHEMLHWEVLLYQESSRLVKIEKKKGFLNEDLCTYMITLVTNVTMTAVSSI
jgi:hypothetical protein